MTCILTAVLFLCSFLLLGSSFRNNRRRGNECGEALHKTALAAGCIVGVDHASLSGAIQSADCLENSFFCIGIVLCECFAGSGNSSTSRATEIAISNAALFILTIAFDL